MQTKTISTSSDGYMNTMTAAVHYGVGPEMLRRWREQKGFPDHAVQRRGQYAFWHVPSINKWLLARLERKSAMTGGTGPRPRWADLVMSETANR